MAGIFFALLSLAVSALGLIGAPNPFQAEQSTLVGELQAFKLDADYKRPRRGRYKPDYLAEVRSAGKTRVVRLNYRWLAPDIHKRAQGLAKRGATVSLSLSAESRILAIEVLHEGVEPAPGHRSRDLRSLRWHSRETPYVLMSPGDPWAHYASRYLWDDILFSLLFLSLSAFLISEATFGVANRRKASERLRQQFDSRVFDPITFLPSRRRRVEFVWVSLLPAVFAVLHAIKLFVSEDRGKGFIFIYLTFAALLAWLAYFLWRKSKVAFKLSPAGITVGPPFRRHIPWRKLRSVSVSAHQGIRRLDLGIKTETRNLNMLLIGFDYENDDILGCINAYRSHYSGDV